jgi:hypothetical protein
MHELGHNLNLSHGGGDDVNCKPNYLSIMNYAFQFSNFVHDRPLDYSRELNPSLNEGQLSEPDGVQGVLTRGYRTAYGPPLVRTARVDVPIDWNRDGDADDIDVAVNINNFGIWGCSQNRLEVLTGYHDWINIQYNFRTSPHFEDGNHPDPTDEAIVELSAEDFLAMLQNQVEALFEEIASLLPDAFKSPRLSKQLKGAFYGKLLNDKDSVANLLKAWEFREAIDKLLHDVRAKFDGKLGGHSRNDWIVDPESQQLLCWLVDDFVESLQKQI